MNVVTQRPLTDLIGLEDVGYECSLENKMINFKVFKSKLVVRIFITLLV